mgnify:CR=1 FL=1
MSILRAGLFLLLAATANSHANEQHESGHIASPEKYELLLENERALVLKMVLKPGESDSFHRHNNETVYFEKGSKLISISCAKSVAPVEGVVFEAR